MFGSTFQIAVKFLVGYLVLIPAYFIILLLFQFASQAISDGAIVPHWMPKMYAQNEAAFTQCLQGILPYYLYTSAPITGLVLIYNMGLKIVKRWKPEIDMRDYVMDQWLATIIVGLHVQTFLFASIAGVWLAPGFMDPDVDEGNWNLWMVLTRVGLAYMEGLGLQIGLTIGVLLLFKIDYDSEYEEARADRLIAAHQAVPLYGAIPVGGGPVGYGAIPMGGGGRGGLGGIIGWMRNKLQNMRGF